jgi:transposase InsO family protein
LLVSSTTSERSAHSRGGNRAARIEREIVAHVVPEPTNAHDKNAVMVKISGKEVGYLSRINAVRYAPGIRHLAASSLGARQSIGATRACWDNAAAESFFRDPQARTHPPTPLDHPRRGTPRRDPLDRGLVQHPTAALDPRLQVTHRIRTNAGQVWN